MLERELTRETGKHSLNAILPKEWVWKRVPDSGKRVNSAGFDGWLKHIPSGKIFVIEVKIKNGVLTKSERSLFEFMRSNYYILAYLESSWLIHNYDNAKSSDNLTDCLNWLLRQP